MSSNFFRVFLLIDFYIIGLRKILKLLNNRIIISQIATETVKYFLVPPKRNLNEQRINALPCFK